MKVKGIAKKVSIIILVVIMLFSTLISAYAYTNEADLPHISRWVNGKAAAADGAFLYDTWAVDDTNVSESKYVLVDQEAVETMRVAVYPDDITNGNGSVCLTYGCDFTLSLPENVSGEVILTFENDNALYHLYFNEENSYSASASFLPGEYVVSDVDVVLQPNGEFNLADNFKLKVVDKKVSANLEVVVDTPDEETSSVGDEKKTEGILNTDKDKENTKGNTEQDNVAPGAFAFDENGDLLGDTVKLCIAVGVLLVAYLVIKRKREKEEELHR